MKKLVISILSLLMFFQFVFAQEEKTYQTKEIFTALNIDGNLDEEAWKQVPWTGDFIQTEPENGVKPTFETQFKIVYDKNNLYVAIRAFDNQPDSIVVLPTARDFFDGDYVEINIDSDFDRKDAFSFTVTAAGIRGDEHILTSDNWFNDWNPNWKAKTKIDHEGWLAEMSIPLSELEIHTKTNHWGIQINRSLERLDEYSSWTSIADEDKWVEYFGLLEGIENIPIPKVISNTDKISPKLLRQDLTDLHYSLKSSYPSSYRYHSSEYMDGIYQDALGALEEELTLIDFYKIISEYLSEFGDGHMKVKFPKSFADEYFTGHKKLPFKIDLSKQGAFISENYSQNSLLNDARIISINGESIPDIAHKITKLISSDGHNMTGKYYKASEKFNFYYSLTSVLRETSKIELLPKGANKIHSLNMNLLNDDEITRVVSAKEVEKSKGSFDYQLKDNVAILTIRTFNNAEGFEKFIDQSFQKIANANIDKLILDFRGNGGGEETNAIHLYSYLSTKPFQYYDRYEVLVEPERKMKQEATLISYETLNFLADISSKDVLNRHVITNLKPLGNRFINPNALQESKTEYNFEGQIIALIDGGSFSATSEICAIMKRDKRATFVGTETGGGFDGNTSGLYDQVTLPNSRIKIRIPLVKYVSATEKADFIYGRGVMPDYPMIEYPSRYSNSENDRLVDFGIEYLNSIK